MGQDARTHNAKVDSCCYRGDFDHAADRMNLRIFDILGCSNATKAQEPHTNPYVKVVVPFALVEYQMRDKSERGKHRWTVCYLDELRHDAVGWYSRISDMSRLMSSCNPVLSFVRERSNVQLRLYTSENREHDQPVSLYTALRRLRWRPLQRSLN